MLGNIGNIIVLLIVLVISAIPLNLAMKMLGGKSSILKVILANLLAGIAYILLHAYLGLFAGLASFIVMILIYREIFKVGWIRVLLALVLEVVIIIIFWIALAAIGISLFLL